VNEGYKVNAHFSLCVYKTLTANLAQYHFPEKSVVTVWSAPNYCYRCGNVASIMTVDRDHRTKFSIFSAVPDDQRHTPGNRRGAGDYFL